MYHIIPVQVTKGVDKHGELEEGQTCLYCEEVYIESIRRSSKDVVFVQPVLNDEYCDKYGSAERNHNPIESYNIGEDYIECKFLDEVEMGVLVELVELHLVAVCFLGLFAAPRSIVNRILLDPLEWNNIESYVDYACEEDQTLDSAAQPHISQQVERA